MPDLKYIRQALADPKAPWYGSDLVSAVGDLVDEFERLREELKEVNREIDAEAGEREQLRAENAELTQNYEQYVNDVKTAEEAEIERLRTLIRVVDHPILDRIARRVNNLIGQIKLRRESECLEFRDKDGQWYEIVVRPINGPIYEKGRRNNQ